MLAKSASPSNAASQNLCAKIMICRNEAFSAGQSESSPCRQDRAGITLRGSGFCFRFWAFLPDCRQTPRHGSLSLEENRLGISTCGGDLQPACDNGCERASSSKDDRARIIASPHPAPAFYPAEAILDSIASLVKFSVVVDFILLL